MTQQNPESERIETDLDAAVCDLLAGITQFSDDHFESDWMHLTDREVMALAVKAICHLQASLNSRLLAGWLLEIRSSRAQKESA